MLFCWFHSKR